MRLTCLAIVLGAGLTVHAQNTPPELLGAWSSTTMYVDKNQNGTLEEVERKTPVKGASDYLKLNADGSCEFYPIKLKGRYELQPRNDKSRKLMVFDKDNNKVDKGVIVSVTKEELVLLNVSTRGFSVYTRQ